MARPAVARFAVGIARADRGKKKKRTDPLDCSIENAVRSQWPVSQKFDRRSDGWQEYTIFITLLILPPGVTRSDCGLIRSCEQLNVGMHLDRKNTFLQKHRET